MKFCTDTPILDPIHPKLKHQARTLNPHIERKIQIIKLDALRRRQPREERLGHGVEVRSERAHVDEAFSEGVRRNIHIAGNQIVFDDKRLTGPEIACVVERDGL